MPTFLATLQLDGRTATGFVVPPAVVEALGGGRQPLVHVTLGGGYTYRSKLGVRGGAHKLPVSAEHRAGAGLEAGEEVEVTLELDTDPREVEVPADLAEALAAAPEAQAAFAALSDSRKRAITTNVEGTKNPETRARRIAKALETLTP